MRLKGVDVQVVARLRPDSFRKPPTPIDTSRALLDHRKRYSCVWTKPAEQFLKKADP